jgi:hypothetical protein
MSNLKLASFDEALTMFNTKYGEIPANLSGAAPYMFGAAEAPAGYYSRADVGERSTVDGTPLPVIWDDFQTRLNVFNRVTDGFLAMIGFPVAKTTDRVAIPRRAKMEKATEFGQPALIRTERVARGYFLEHYDLGFGFTQEFLDDADSSEIKAIGVLAEDAWGRIQRENALRLLFEEDNFTDTKEGIAVKKLYNGDGEIPPDYEGYTFAGSHTHYLYSAGTAYAEADLNAMEESLLEHGYGDNSMFGAGGGLTLHASRATITKIRAFTDFIPADSSQIAELLVGEVVGQRASGFAMPIEGTFHRWAVIENAAIPAGYILGLASGGEYATQNPLGIRVHSNASARGLRLNPGRNDYPLMDSFYDGYVGGGVRHRGSAVVMYEDTGAGAAYVDPTF